MKLSYASAKKNGGISSWQFSADSAHLGYSIVFTVDLRPLITELEATAKQFQISSIIGVASVEKYTNSNPFSIPKFYCILFNIMTRQCNCNRFILSVRQLIFLNFTKMPSKLFDL